MNNTKTTAIKHRMTTLSISVKDEGAGSGSERVGLSDIDEHSPNNIEALNAPVNDAATCRWSCLPTALRCFQLDFSAPRG
jgi:hypothetical protein